jgi:hypothetical protein
VTDRSINSSGGLDTELRPTDSERRSPHAARWRSARPRASRAAKRVPHGLAKGPAKGHAGIAAAALRGAAPAEPRPPAEQGAATRRAGARIADHRGRAPGEKDWRGTKSARGTRRKDHAAEAGPGQTVPAARTHRRDGPACGAADGNGQRRAVDRGRGCVHWCASENASTALLTGPMRASIRVDGVMPSSSVASRRYARYSRAAS